MEPLRRLEREEAMDRERAMQRLNALTLAAFLIGFAAFIYDSSTPRSPRMTADVPAWNSAPASLSNAPGIPASLD